MRLMRKPIIRLSLRDAVNQGPIGGHKVKTHSLSFVLETSRRVLKYAAHEWGGHLGVL